MGAHIFLSENEPFPKWNGPLLSIARIIKFVMSSASEAELGALYVTAKEMAPLRQTLIEMGWPQPPSPLQTDNSAAAGVVNKTIVAKKLKSMDLRYHWLRCREAQDQFRMYWDSGTRNWGDYSSKHHPPRPSYCPTPAVCYDGGCSPGCLGTYLQAPQHACVRLGRSNCDQ